jgi:hypothetical protein
MRFVVLASLALIEGCGAAQPAGGAKTASRPPREPACPLARATKESPECFAVRCAEDFVRRNGYTGDAATGPIVPESVHPVTLEERQGMLDGAAVGYRPYPPGHLVVFRYSGSTGKTARAVTMSGDFDGLRVEHQDFRLSAALSIPDCARGGPG